MITKAQANEITGSETALDELCGLGLAAWVTDRVAVLKKTQRSLARSCYAAFLHDPDGAISHQTALALWLDETPHSTVDYSVSWSIDDAAPTSTWINIHQVDDLEPGDVRIFRSTRNFRITSPSRTILDCALEMDYGPIGYATWCLLEAGKLSEKEFDQLSADLIARDANGQLVVNYVERLRSETREQAMKTETRIMQLLVDGNFPEPVRDYRMAIGKGQYETIDLAWPDRGVGIDLTEPQSCNPNIPKSERDRLRKLAKAGMYLITFSPNPRDEPEIEVIEALARHLDIDWSPPHEHDEYCYCSLDEEDSDEVRPAAMVPTSKAPQTRLASITVLRPSGPSLN